MSPILSLLRTAHCRSTHHYFAVDALSLVQTDAGKRLKSQLLYYHDRYLRGAKDPDIRFRDFQNHVVHVTDGYWGGAPRVAHLWYDKLQRYLRNDQFADAAYAAGVLSHYFTDPLQPLHTQPSVREKILHRPIEWSITKSYQAIYRIWREDDLRIVVQLSGEPGWLGEAILHGARFANRKYQLLLDQYDLQSGLQDPASGLNAELRESIAELFGLSITGLARVLERAAADAEATRQAPIPTAGTAVPMLVAALCAPARLWQRRIEHRRQRLAVQAMIDEFRRTGTLTDHLPAEVDIVHRVTQIYQDEKRWRQQRAARLASQQTVIQAKSTTPQPKSTDDAAVLLSFPSPDQRPPATVIAHGKSRRDPPIEAPRIEPADQTQRRSA